MLKWVALSQYFSTILFCFRPRKLTSHHSKFLQSHPFSQKQKNKKTKTKTKTKQNQTKQQKPKTNQIKKSLSPIPTHISHPIPYPM